MNARVVVAAVAAVAVVIGGAWWLRGPRVAEDVRITPRLVAPGDTLTCSAASPRWRVDGRPAGTTRELRVPDEVGAAVVCEGDGASDVVGIAADATPGNVLLVILDDVGVDRIGPYGVSKQVPKTPTIDRLADEGLTFTRAYVSASCTPTRAALMTGRHAMNTGLGSALSRKERGMRDSEWILPEALDAVTGEAYTHAAIGKWHLTTPEEGADQPNTMGFDHYAGNLANLNAAKKQFYGDWTRVEDGEAARTKTYATTDHVDATLRFIERAGDDPWFVWLAFNAAHVPMHWPPNGLGGKRPTKLNDAAKFDGMVHAADRELGRLLDEMDPDVLARTTILVIGDNGTAKEAVRPPTTEDTAKNSLAQGGIHVPLVIAGPHVVDPGRRVDALTMHTDLFETILELAGGTLTAEQRDGLDGRSILRHLTARDAPTHRTFAYLERFIPNGFDLERREFWERAVVHRDYKLIVGNNGRMRLHRLDRPGLDGPDLLAGGSPPDEARQAMRAMRRALDERFVPRR